MMTVGPSQALTDRPCKPSDGAVFRKGMVLSDQTKGEEDSSGTSMRAEQN